MVLVVVVVGWWCGERVGEEDRRKPPTSHYDSLGVLVLLLGVETEVKPPTSRNDSLGSLLPESNGEEAPNVSK